MGMFSNPSMSLQKIMKLPQNFRFFFSSPSLLRTKSQLIDRRTSNFAHSSTTFDDVVLSENHHNSIPCNSSTSGLEDVMMGYIFGKKKATEVAHLVWKNVVRKGDAVVDATCGNGYDTLAMLRLVADETRKGRVYAMDIQKNAIESTSHLLDQSVGSDERDLVEVYAICHTKMEEIVPRGLAVRLVAFNLGYLPGGDKRLKTHSETTLLALQAAERILARGGLISIVVYLGHSGGREEFEIVQSFASGLSVDKWGCCKLQMLNRPLAPVLVLLSRK